MKATSWLIVSLLAGALAGVGWLWSTTSDSGNENGPPLVEVPDNHTANAAPNSRQSGLPSTAQSPLPTPDQRDNRHIPLPTDVASQTQPATAPDESDGPWVSRVADDRVPVTERVRLLRVYAGSAFPGGPGLLFSQEEVVALLLLIRDEASPPAVRLEAIGALRNYVDHPSFPQVTEAFLLATEAADTEVRAQAVRVLAQAVPTQNTVYILEQRSLLERDGLPLRIVADGLANGLTTRREQDRQRAAVALARLAARTNAPIEPRLRALQYLAQAPLALAVVARPFVRQVAMNADDPDLRQAAQRLLDATAE